MSTSESRPRKPPQYEAGDYIKAEFADEATGIGEWMWVRVQACDDVRQIVIGELDNGPVNDYGRKLKLGSVLSVSFSQIREHRKSTEFRMQ